MTPPEVTRLSTLTDELWRNGAGRTITLATGVCLREELHLAPGPESGHEADVRVSLATLTRPTPFSLHPRHDRIFTLIEGGPIELVVDGQPREVAPFERIRLTSEATISMSRIDTVARAVNIFFPRATAAPDVRIGSLGVAAQWDGAVSLEARANGQAVGDSSWATRDGHPGGLVGRCFLIRFVAPSSCPPAAPAGSSLARCEAPSRPVPRPLLDGRPAADRPTIHHRSGERGRAGYPAPPNGPVNSVSASSTGVTGIGSEPRCGARARRS